MVKEIESYDQFRTLVSGPDVVVVDYYAPWCGPCKVISPHFAKMEEDFPNIKFAKMDVDAQGQIADDENIQAMPTFAVYKNGKQVKHVVEPVPAKLKALLEVASGL